MNKYIADQSIQLFNGYPSSLCIFFNRLSQRLNW